MDIEKIQSIFNGTEPSLDDYILLVGIAEECQPDLLWKLLTSNPSAHWLVRSVLNNALQEKVPRKATDQAIASIINRLT